MKRLLALMMMFLCLLVLNFATPGQAAAEDIETLECGELLNMDDEEIGIIIIWIDGYYSGKMGETDFDPDSWEDLGELVGAACANNPRRRVIEAIDDVIHAITGQSSP